MTHGWRQVCGRTSRRLQYIGARFLRRKTARLDGLTLLIHPATVPQHIHRGIVYGSYERQERRLIAKMVSASDRILDIGSCIGLTAILSARIVGGDHVLAYEANPSLESLIRTNFRLNDVSPQLRMRAITADGRDATLFLQRRWFSSSLFERDAQSSVVVPSDALTDVIAEFRPTAILMDVEGAEEELLTATSFPGVAKIIIEFHPHIIGKDAVMRCEDRLAAAGFRLKEHIDDVAAFSRSLARSQ